MYTKQTISEFPSVSFSIVYITAISSTFDKTENCYSSQRFHIQICFETEAQETLNDLSVSQSNINNFTWEFNKVGITKTFLVILLL